MLGLLMERIKEYQMTKHIMKIVKEMSKIIKEDKEWK